LKFRSELSEKLLLLEFDFAKEAKRVEGMSLHDYFEVIGAAGGSDPATKARFSYVSNHPGTESPREKPARAAVSAIGAR